MIADPIGLAICEAPSTMPITNDTNNLGRRSLGYTAYNGCRGDIGEHFLSSQHAPSLALRVTIIMVLAIAGALATSAPALSAAEPATGLRAPAGFRVELYADDALAHDIYSMTIDSHGRVVVSGKDYVKILHDDDRDGRADRATLFSSVPKNGAHGMVFDGSDLICTGDNALLRLRDSNHDGKTDGAPEVWASLRNPEHGANGVVRGPDGWFYVICGNEAGVTAELAKTKSSPVAVPDCGVIVRFSPDGKASEIVAHGFRNPYDADFDAYGRILLVDSDGERDQYLPWYSPTRLFDVAWGQHHGWVQRGWQHSWNRPQVFFDSVPRLVELGRGSPTGSIVYRHRQFPARYRDNVFSCCWTLGRIYHVRLTPKDGSYTGESDIFLETTGEVGFAPVDLQVGPAGDLFVAIGGRQTRGSVFRVTYVGEASGARQTPDVPEPVRPSSDVDRVLRADQPLSAWSRAMWLPLARKLGRETFARAAVDDECHAHQRIRSLEVLAELWDGVTVELAESLRTADPPQVGARAIRLLTSHTESRRNVEFLVRVVTTPQVDPDQARAAWESLGRFAADDDASVAALVAARRETGVRLRSAALWAVRQVDPAKGGPAKSHVESLAQLRLQLARGTSKRGADEFALLAPLLSAKSVKSLAPLADEALRIAELELGDVRSEPTEPPVFAGYAPKRPAPHSEGRFLATFAGLLTAVFPTGEPTRDREIARLLGMLQVDLRTNGDADSDETGERLAKLWTDKSRVEDDLHYLIVLSRLPGPRSSKLTLATARALAQLHLKMKAGSFTPSRNWPARVTEMFRELLKRDVELAKTLVGLPEFGWAEHSLFVLEMTGTLRLVAARKLADRVRMTSDETALTAELVEVLDSLPASESLLILRPHWDDFALRDDIARVIARHAQPEDRARMVESLGSVQPAVVERAAAALVTIGGRGVAPEITGAYQALRNAALAKEMASTRVALHRLLVSWTGAQLDEPELTADPRAAALLWGEWFRKQRPEIAKQAARFVGGGDAESWRARLEKVDWARGDIDRGKISFEKRACARCHRAADRLGPDLAGTAARFARDDLFTSIVDPSKDVAPLYQTTQVITQSGKVYQGLVVYESPEGTLIQTTPDDTVRIMGDEIVAMRKSRLSLMPVGLLNTATDQELADLYAYLKTLRANR